MDLKSYQSDKQHVFSKKLEAFSIALLFSFSVLIKIALTGHSQKSRPFLAFTSKFFQPLPITQFQSHFPILGVCYNSTILLGTNFCLNTFGLL